jgi:hypothetical protein
MGQVVRGVSGVNYPWGELSMSGYKIIIMKIGRKMSALA